MEHIFEHKLHRILNEERYQRIVRNEFFNAEYNTDNRWIENVEPTDPRRQFREELINNDITVCFEDHYGGEGEGDAYWSVYSFQHGDQKLFVRFDGYYASYVGSEFHEWEWVEPVQQVITVYKSVQR